MTAFLFDGYPRTLQQARSLDELFEGLGLAVAGVLNFVAPREDLLRRLTGRRTCSFCGTTFHIHYNPPRRPDTCDRCAGPIVQRKDDNEQSVSRRLDNFERETRPLLDYYARRDLLTNIDATGQIYDVQVRVQKALRVR